MTPLWILEIDDVLIMVLDDGSYIYYDGGEEVFEMGAVVDWE